jgi:hypothetical protein
MVRFFLAVVAVAGLGLSLSGCAGGGRYGFRGASWSEERRRLSRSVQTSVVARRERELVQGPHGPMPLKGQFAKSRITFSGHGPDGIGGREEFSATAVLST